MISLDGSQGEGGGQILRTALALSLCTEQAFRMTNIRAGRSKPGLMRQHLTAVLAAQQIGKATVSGAEVGSRELTFKPQTVLPGNYTFAVGTAGSATLVFQTVLPALLTAGAKSKLTLQGGTHNPFAPPYDFLKLAFAPQIQRLGVGLELNLHKLGFYPAGGGEFIAQIEPVSQLKPFSLLERGELKDRKAYVYLANLPMNIAEREIAALRTLLNWPEECFSVRTFSTSTPVPSPGPGNVVMVEQNFEHVTELTTGFGERGVSVEHVARDTVEAVRRHQFSPGAVGDYLSDQLLVPFALAGGGEWRQGQPSSHAITNAQTIQKFLSVKIHFRQEEEGKVWRCVVGS